MKLMHAYKVNQYNTKDQGVKIGPRHTVRHMVDMISMFDAAVFGYIWHIAYC